VAPPTADSYDRGLGGWAPHEALGAVWELISAANKYAVEVAPWSLERGDPRVRTALFHLVEALRLTAVFCAPLLPGTSREILTRLGAAPIKDWRVERAWGLTKPETSIAEGPSLFPKKRRD
jgi:methionyl-tRNA synthetase